MMRILILLTLALLAACATRPLQYEDDDVIIVKGMLLIKRPDQRTPAELQRVTAHYTAPVFDERERAMWRHLLFGHGLDVGTTLVGLDAGCRETFPGLGKRPGILALLLVKGLPLWHWWHHAHQSPAAFSSADSLVARINVASGYGAAAWNAWTIAGGCVR
jgi:hypothetical protein